MAFDRTDMRSWHERSQISADTLPSVAAIWGILLVIVGGSVLQSVANATADGFFVALFFLCAGVLIVRGVFPAGNAELRAFLQAYAACVLAGGLAQCYSLAVFGNLQSTVDAAFFFGSISPAPPFTTVADVALFVDSYLPILTWQQIYKAAWLLGLDFGPYTGVMFNAFLIGLAGSVTVRTARELFGPDLWRLRRVGTLFSFCGLFILFGAVFIRDSFTTVLNAVVLWWIIRWLLDRTAAKLFAALTVTGISAFAMIFLRAEAVALFGLFWLLTFLFWFFEKRMDFRRLAVVCAAICVMIIARPYVMSSVQTAETARAVWMTGYNEITARESGQESLGARLVANQPLPVRVVLNSALFMVYPIPLWAYFKIGMGDYNWIKGYHGVYQVIVLPLVFAGFLGVIRLFRRDRKQGTPLLFLVTYLVLNTVAVSATSGEQRHLAQFMPAFMILAALPDTRDPKSRRELGEISKWWIAVVIFVHLAWMIMKG